MSAAYANWVSSWGGRRVMLGGRGRGNAHRRRGGGAAPLCPAVGMCGLTRGLGSRRGRVLRGCRGCRKGGLMSGSRRPVWSAIVQGDVGGDAWRTGSVSACETPPGAAPIAACWDAEPGRARCPWMAGCARRGGRRSGPGPCPKWRTQEERRHPGDAVPGRAAVIAQGDQNRREPLYERAVVLLGDDEAGVGQQLDGFAGGVPGAPVRRRRAGARSEAGLWARIRRIDRAAYPVSDAAGAWADGDSSPDARVILALSPLPLLAYAV